MKNLSELVKGMTKTQKILAATAVVAIVTLAVVGTVYGAKHLKAKKAIA